MVMRTILILHSGEGQVRGSEICLIQAIKALSESDFDLVVLRKSRVLDESISEYVSSILDEPFPEIMFDGSYKSFPLIDYLRSSLRLFRLVKRLRPAVIYCNTGLPCQLAVPVGKLLNIPVLCHFHHPAPKRYFYIWLVKYATKLVFPSKYTQSLVKEKCGRDGKVIYNAVDVDTRFIPVSHRDNSYRKQLGINESSIVVGQVGNLTKHKRPDLLLRCFAEAYSHNVNLHLVLVGEGPLREELQSLIVDLRLMHVVTLTGYVPDVVCYYQHIIDINVLASNAEGLGISVIEASACAIPSIVTDCTGLREVVDDNITGLTFESDDAGQLTNGILRLADDSRLRRNLALAARKKVEREFTLERYKCEIVDQIQGMH